MPGPARPPGTLGDGPSGPGSAARAPRARPGATAATDPRKATGEHHMTAIYVEALLFAIVGGLTAAALRLPPLVGFLAAGFGLGAAGVDAIPGLDVAANLGVTILLFTIGLQLDPRSLLKVRAAGTAAGHAVAYTLLVAVVLGLASLLPLALFAGTGFGVFLLIGLATSFSSTVFVMAQLEESGRMRSTSGSIAISILVLQDIVAVAFLVLSADDKPALWAPALIILPLLRPLVNRLPDRGRRTELMVLGGVAVAMAAYALFDAAGVSGDFGALLAGMTLSGHPISDRFFDALMEIKELLLVGFFLQIGLGGVPTPAGFAIAGLLLLLIPVKAAVFIGLLHAMRLSNRTTAITALIMANYSEFGLIVASVAVAGGTLPETWVPVMGVTVAASFILSTLVGIRSERIISRITDLLPTVPEERLTASERPVHVEGVDALVIGMGRVGIGVYRRLADEHDLEVAGIEFDEDRCADLAHRGLRVIHGDGTDPDLWRRMRGAGRGPRLIVLAMPEHDANLTVLKLMRATELPLTVAAVAHQRHTTFDLIEHGADAVTYLYEGAGRELADFAWEAWGQDHPEAREGRD